MPPSWPLKESFQQTAQLNNGGPFASTQVVLTKRAEVSDVICVATTTATDQTGGAPTLTDQLGNNYVKQKATYEASNDTTWITWLCTVTVAGIPTITFDPGASSQNWLAIFGDHFYGVRLSVARDSKSATQATPGTGVDAITTGSFNPQFGDLQWGFASDDNISSGGTLVVGTGFIAANVFNGVIRTAYRIATGPAAVTFTDPTNGGTHTYSSGGIAVTTDVHFEERSVVNRRVEQSV